MPFVGAWVRGSATPPLLKRRMQCHAFQCALRALYSNGHLVPTYVTFAFLELGTGVIYDDPTTWSYVFVRNTVVAICEGAANNRYILRLNPRFGVREIQWGGGGWKECLYFVGQLRPVRFK